MFSKSLFFSKVRYTQTQIRKRQMQRIHVFMARPVHYFGEDEIFDKLSIFFLAFFFFFCLPKVKAEKKRLSKYSITVFALCIERVIIFF